jgi:aminomethyltransferase
MQHTALHDTHINLGAKMVPFAGFEMPIQYTSLMEEHHAVRKDAGMFDVSHMVIVDFEGERTFHFLQHLVANDVKKCGVGRALYTCMLNESGGVIDDLIVYQPIHNIYRVVVNAACREKDLAWMIKHAKPFNVKLTAQDDLSMVAIQGPNAREKVASCLPPECAEPLMALKRFGCIKHHNSMTARTGYTGEDGFELMLPHDKAVSLWDKLAAAGVKPCGLGARDTLRLEAGLNLYGQDMTDTTTPLESNLAWTVALEGDDFIGKAALLENLSPTQKLVGVVLEDKGVLRAGQKVMTEHGDGITTSGTFSPTLGVAIAMARVPIQAQGPVHVEIRNKTLKANIVNMPFVSQKKSTLTS